EKTELFLEDNNYPSHNELIKKINEKNKLARMLGISNPLLQKLVIWGFNNHQLSIDVDKIKYFNRYIKENKNNELFVDESSLKTARRLPLIFILAVAFFVVFLQELVSDGLYVYFSFFLIAAFGLLFALIDTSLAPSKIQTEDIKKLIQKYNDRNKEND
ncbi:hypothetical protein, partial [Providencia hangzhouensis]